jgi:acetyltransferase
VAGAVARARERGIAVRALKLGGSETGARAARSHTPTRVGARDTWRAWARAAGLVEVRGLDELLEAARYVAAAPALRGDRAGLVTSSGGIAVLLADALEPRGFTFPALAPGTRERVAALLPRYATVGNPLDITAGLPDEVFGDVLAAMLADPGLDLLLVPLTMATADGGRARAEQVSRALQRAAKPVAVFWPGGSLVRKGHEALEAAGVPLFTSVATCAAALGAARALRCRRPRAGATGSSGLTLPAVLRGGALPWAEVRAVLAAAGVRTAPEVVVTTEAEARRAAVGLAYPVAVKLLGPLHKTEVGGVRLGLATPEAMLAAVRELLPRGDGCLVQPMVEGVEVLVGALRDPALGAFVVLAAGGIHAELYGARAMRPAPLGPEEARGMLAETTALAALLAGHRGRPASDRESLLDVVVRVGALAVALGPRLRELDLNPVIVGADGATVVDARIVLAA